MAQIQQPAALDERTMSAEDEALARLKEVEEEEARNVRLDTLGQTLFKYRREAIEYRISTGIEDEWRAAQDAYEGYDEQNRPEHDTKRAAWSSRPVGQTLAQKNATRSSIFLNITQPYVNAAAAKVADMLIPTDERPWGLSVTPVPELIDAKDSQTQITLPNGQQAKEGELIKRIMEIADKKAKRAEQRIEDWLTDKDCQWHAHARRVVNDSARTGSGIMKGPIPKKIRRAYMDSNAMSPDGNPASGLKIKETINPVSATVNCWNLFPDPACGENIHNGNWIWERDDITEKSLRALKGTTGYIDRQIDLVLSEGPQLPAVETRDFAPYDINGRMPFDIWYFTGNLSRADVEAVGCECPDEDIGNIAVVVTMVNNRVIKGALNPLDSGEFPYDVLPWQMREGYWAGIGVAQQISVPQRAINAAARQMSDNSGITAGPQIVFSDSVVPVDGKYELTPRKLWRAKADADIQDINKAFIAIQIDPQQENLLAIIQFYLKMAEDVTGLPMLLQGQQGKAPDTVGGMTMLQNNASSVLRRMARLFDDKITEPHIGRYYDWLMQYSEDPEEKGDCSIDARASSVLVERDLQNTAVVQMLALSTNPAFGADPRKCYAEACRAQKLDPTRFQYTEDEWENVQANQQQQPEDPRIAVAQLKGDMDERNRQWLERMKQLEFSFQGQQNERERALKAAIAELNADLKAEEQKGHRVISIDNVRAKLADRTIQERSKARLFESEKRLKLSAKNPTHEGV